MIKLMLDAGHGGKDPGATAHGYKEKDIALKVVKALEVELERCGFQVKQTRTGDTFPSLSERAKMANQWKANGFVSIHLNAASDSSARGFETFAYKSQYAKLAKAIHKAVIADKDLYTRDRGVKYGDFAVLRETNMDAALVELGFISNKVEAKMIDTKVKEFAVAIAKGICAHFGVKYKIPAPPKPVVSKGNPVNTGKTFSTKGKGTVQVVVDSLNVRSDAGTDNKVVGSLKKGAKVKVLGSKEGWYKVKDGQYISGSETYVKHLG